MQRSHRFCNTPTLDDGSRSGRKYLGNNHLLEFYQPIPAGYHKINAATKKDIYKNMLTKHVYIVQGNIH